MKTLSFKEFVTRIPKAELHLHIEGTLEPELLFQMASRNRVSLNFHSEDALRSAYQFGNLQDFLDLYYAGASVLLREQDFYDLTWAYMKKMKEQNVLHTEIFFDPQTHTSRGVRFGTVIEGIHQALEDAEKAFHISSVLIMSFLRHLDEASAIRTLQDALSYKDWIAGVGLDSSEKGNAPTKFLKVFEMARSEGFLAFAHAGEEGPAQYVWEAINDLKVTRVDHGNRSLEDDRLISELVARQIPLTLCPLSNLRLQVIKELKEHPLKKMMQKGLMITVNSDDPAYFGGYLNENYLALAEALDLGKEEIFQLARNSFQASLLEEDRKQALVEQTTLFYRENA